MGTITLNKAIKKKEQRKVKDFIKESKLDSPQTNTRKFSVVYKDCMEIYKYNIIIIILLVTELIILE